MFIGLVLCGANDGIDDNLTEAEKLARKKKKEGVEDPKTGVDADEFIDKSMAEGIYFPLKNS